MTRPRGFSGNHAHFPSSLASALPIVIIIKPASTSPSKMYRTTLRSAPSALRAIRPVACNSASSSARRLLTTSSPQTKKRTWKGAAARWGLAIGAVYWYNTSPIFADELPPQTGPAPPQFSNAELPTIDAVVEEKRRKAIAAAPPPPSPPVQDTRQAIESAAAPAEKETADAQAEAHEPGSPEALEQEAAAQGAFNPETGEINWDCPCLGGMADGPCGEEFKAAFSCFVYSTDEPKGMDCIDKFQHMQDCFRKYPDVYGAEIADDEDEAPASAPEGAEAALAKELPESDGAAAAPAAGSTSTAVTAAKAATPVADTKAPTPHSESDEIPKEAFDATSANKGSKQ
ncbi:hypothetical protein B0T17DRAFT_535592 [Bombardia bombarda]|uniref:Mitochondrial intermembrane space import and assembly protein 40 n=1 Tax=Bombardia bombarda TaxID=252184 RepID=A0AA39WVB1_9PEZI|nr:hypothetical protein B0T17DRAFT_535592 [Bombardia bombarda]